MKVVNFHMSDAKGTKHVFIQICVKWAMIHTEKKSFLPNYFLLCLRIASYFHKGLMWRGVKVEISRKNGSGYNNPIFSKVL